MATAYTGLSDYFRHCSAGQGDIGLDPSDIDKIRDTPILGITAEETGPRFGLRDVVHWMEFAWSKLIGFCTRMCSLLFAFNSLALVHKLPS
jgi:hypothetical protein